MSTNQNKPLQKCADCLHAKVFKELSGTTGRFRLSVRCAKGHWKVGRKHGHCDLSRVLSRRRHGCTDYCSMSDNETDRERYLEQLREDLPVERILYEPNGEATDLTEDVL